MMHARSRRDEMILVIEGEPTLLAETNVAVVAPGVCVGFPAGGNAHHYGQSNRTGRRDSGNWRPDCGRTGDLTRKRPPGCHGRRGKVAVETQGRNAVPGIGRNGLMVRVPRLRRPVGGVRLSVFRTVAFAARPACARASVRPKANTTPTTATGNPVRTLQIVPGKGMRLSLNQASQQSQPRRDRSGKVPFSCEVFRIRPSEFEFGMIPVEQFVIPWAGPWRDRDSRPCSYAFKMSAR